MASKQVMEALQLHHKGFNCAQSVVLPFCEQFGIDKTMAMRSVEGFGGGMGSFSQTCGALSGAMFLLGLKNSDGNIVSGPKSKSQTYSECKAVTSEFEKECGATSCYDLKGIGSGKPLKTCDQCVIAAATIVEKFLK